MTAVLFVPSDDVVPPAYVLPEPVTNVSVRSTGPSLGVGSAVSTFAASAGCGGAASGGGVGSFTCGVGSGSGSAFGSSSGSGGGGSSSLRMSISYCERR